MSFNDLEGTGNGCWLVIKDDNSTSYRQIDPLFAELDAALHFLREGMIKKMLEKSSMRPINVKLTKKEKRAWEAYQKIMGKDKTSFFEYPSMHEIAEHGCKYVRNILLENEMNIEKIAKKHCKKTRRNSRIKINPISDLEV
jgi:hypothetical protein